ncbi:hypothetical protein QT971_14745 [Microcoleus sp. herbarium19]|uniref:hypothetical protein n=1 Tax=unclassified Microcoleus TaxID=2642155 RepID=UPI002FD247CE
MPQRIYNLPPDKSGNLVVSWQRGWRMYVIRLNGKSVGTIANLKMLSQKHKIFHFRDGSTLRIELFYTGAILFDFSLFLNDERLYQKNRFAGLLAVSYCTILFLGGVNFLAGLFLLAGLLDSWYKVLIFLCIGVSSLVYGGITAVFVSSALYLILGFLVWKRSGKALVITLTLVFLDSAVLILALLWGSGELAVFVQPLLISRIVILTSAAIGLEGFEELHASSATSHQLPFIIFPKVKQLIVNILAILIDPISWIFNKVSQNNSQD